MNDTTKNMRTAEQLTALADTLERIGASGASVDALRRRCNVYRGDVTFDESGDRWKWVVYENGRPAEVGFSNNHDTAEDELAARLAMLIPAI